ncbi:MAG: hypothetical protein PHQ81_07395 [Methanofollis sp.]|nr:hypothetical protein [Methanofollis sp.]
MTMRSAAVFDISCCDGGSGARLSPLVEESVLNFWKEALRFEGMFIPRKFWDILNAYLPPGSGTPLTEETIKRAFLGLRS